MSKDTNIMAQTAIKAAATLFQGTGNVDGAAAAAARFYNGIIALGGNPDSYGPTDVPIAQAQQNLQQGGVQGTVVRDLSNEEARWQDALINNPGDWYNNIGDSRATSGGGDGPDFKFKNDKDVKSLFLNGKYGPAPAWVFEKLNLPFPGSAPAAAPAAPAPAQGMGNGNPVPF